jgi:hypothetical protein
MKTSKEKYDSLFSHPIELKKPDWMAEKKVTKNDAQSIKDSSSNLTIILAHPNTDEIKNVLLECINSIKKEKLVSTNYPIDIETQSLTDWVLYDKKNHLLFESEFDDYGVRYFYWKNQNDEIITKNYEYDHGYAVYVLIQNALKFAKSIGKDIVHIVNYDYLIPCEIFDHNEFELSYMDLILYSNELLYKKQYSAGFISGKIDVLLDFFTKYKTKREYYSDFSSLESSVFLEGKMFLHYSNSKFNIKTKNILDYDIKADRVKLIDFSKVNFPDKQTKENDNLDHFYEKIDGWFDFQNIYSWVAKRFDDDSRFVEIGAWKGKSASYMGVEIRNSRKKIKFDCVDTWDGSDEHTNIDSMFYDPLTKVKNGLFDVFMRNIYPVSDYINPIRMASVEASKLYEDESLDFIFIDAAHDYENVKKDILSWFPKLKKNGIIAGHDYTTHEGVKLAVDDLLHVDVSGTSWLYENREIKNKKFSIIIPTYQRTELLYRALQSVRNQNYDNYEVFVCSDGYSEADEKCVIGLKDERFKYHHINPVDFKNYGNIQRNEMLKLCTGDYVFYLDDDNDVASDYLSFANRNLRNDVGMMISKVRLRHVGENVIVPYVKEIKQGFIDTLNLMVKTDVAKKYQWSMLYEADYHFIKDCETHCLQNQIPILYVNKIIGNHN